jgi:hypothetical protein
MTLRYCFSFRPQANYSESVYAEAVKHGLSLDFPEFLELFAKREFREGPVSDYAILLHSCAEVFGFDNVIVRRFRNSGRRADPNRLLVADDAGV